TTTGGAFSGGQTCTTRSSGSASSTTAAVIATVSSRTTVARTVCSAQASASFGSLQPTSTTPLTRSWLKSAPPSSALFSETEPIQELEEAPFPETGRFPRGHE